MRPRGLRRSRPLGKVNKCSPYDNEDLLTPSPFANKQSRFNTMPILSGMTSDGREVIKPEKRTERGTRKAAPIRVPLSLSSGTQIPPRNLRKRVTNLSDIRPANGAPMKFPSPAGKKNAPINASLVILYLTPCNNYVPIRDG